MFLRAFTKQYDLHLLPAAHSGIRLGNLVWKPFWGLPKLSHPGLPNHISNAFYNVGLLNKAQWSDHLKSFDVKMCRRAKLARIKIQGATVVGATLLEGMGLGFEQGHLIEAEISKVCAKVMKNALRIGIGKHLERLEPRLQRALFRNPRKAYMITELYYGTLTIKVEKNHETAFEEKVMNTDWPIRATLNSDKNHEYTFDHNEVPFAYKMERIHRFNG
jgi:hypothetical protein